MNKVFILLGSNLLEPLLQLARAEEKIKSKVGIIRKESSIYRTAAWGNHRQPDFLNQVLIVETALGPVELLITLLDIEKEMGRIRFKKNEPRIIDIDILFFNNDIINSKELTIPHPRIAERRFVLTPLNELSPRLKHPLTGKTINKMLKECTDDLPVKKN